MAYTYVNNSYVRLYTPFGSPAGYEINAVDNNIVENQTTPADIEITGTEHINARIKEGDDWFNCTVAVGAYSGGVYIVAGAKIALGCPPFTDTTGGEEFNHNPL